MNYNNYKISNKSIIYDNDYIYMTFNIHDQYESFIGKFTIQLCIWRAYVIVKNFCKDSNNTEYNKLMFNIISKQIYTLHEIKTNMIIQNNIIIEIPRDKSTELINNAYLLGFTPLDITDFDKDYKYDKNMFYYNKIFNINDKEEIEVMEKEKIIYFEEIQNTKEPCNENVKTRCYDIAIETVDGPFKSIYKVGYAEIFHDKEMRMAIIQDIRIIDDYKCLDITGNILDIACNLCSVFGYKGIGINCLNDDKELARIITNKGFKAPDTVDADSNSILYHKGISNLL